MNPLFHGLCAVVQYRLKRMHDDWHTMAAFDSIHAAEPYAEECAANGDRPWEYQAIEVTET